MTEPAIAKVRQANLCLLASRFNFDAQFARAAQISRSQLSQYRACTESGDVRKRMGERLARKIEGNLGLAAGWMDHRHQSVPELKVEAKGQLKQQASLSGETNLKSLNLEGLSELHVLVLTTAARMARKGVLSDTEWISLLTTWQGKEGV
ncbi:hypothetical protein [Burkholderia cenocepacia]|uniref:hypothetical protein n=1 Tax=Burkholderia cenocepacia TaxID=95486 RepID=UPI000761ACA2|nr:hypothetical protein [Burkholderia cenocepacia]